MWRKRNQMLYYFVFLVLVGGALACQDVEIVSRAAWGARPSSMPVPPMYTPVKHVFIAHTVTPECNTKSECSARLRQMQHYRLSSGWSDMGFNFVIGGDGRVYEGVGWSKEGVHTYKWSDKSYGVAFVGNFMSVKPNDKMLLAARKLIVCGIKTGVIADDRWLHGTRDATCSQSPGDALYEIIKEWPRFQGGPLSVYSKC